MDWIYLFRRGAIMWMKNNSTRKWLGKWVNFCCVNSNSYKMLVSWQIQINGVLQYYALYIHLLQLLNYTLVVGMIEQIFKNLQWIRKF